MVYVFVIKIKKESQFFQKKKKKKTSANSLTHTGMRAVLILACKEQCANKADIIAPAQVSSYC